MSKKSPETITFTPQETYDHITIPDEYRDMSHQKETSTFNPSEHMHIADAPTEPNEELERYRHKKDIQRKISKTALRSLETAFSIMSLTQAGTEAATILHELHEPAPTTVEADSEFLEAIAQTREEAVQKYMDALTGLVADEQEKTHAEHQASDIHSTTLQE